jgi:hypothetical protein
MSLLFCCSAPVVSDIVVFDRDKAQYMILTHNRMHSIKINKSYYRSKPCLYSVYHMTVKMVLE